MDGDEDPDDVVLYLVKWRGLPYDQSSWEHFRDIRFASDQILDFWDFCRPQPKVPLVELVPRLLGLFWARWGGVGWFGLGCVGLR